MNQQAENKIYFKGLNGLRFFAAIFVVVTHIELIKQQTIGFTFWRDNILIRELGTFGVVFFFVLSGFLISYLLMAEKEKTNDIAVLKFYMRRALRIWPLYFLIVIVGFVMNLYFPIFSNTALQGIFDTSWKNQLPFYLLILPNVGFAFYGPIAHCGQAWSIGVEEQFYILWPLLFVFSNQILKTILRFIGLLLLLKIVYILYYQSAILHAHDGSFFLKGFKELIAMTKMECMAIGGIGAYIVYTRKEKLMRFIFNPFIQLISFITPILTALFVPPMLQDGAHIIYAISFLVIIMNVSLNAKSFLNLDHKIFNLLGDLSYGIYMYHMIVIAIVIGLLKTHMHINNTLTSQITIYTVVISSTILISYISYQTLEKYFLKLKNKFSIIQSGR